MIDRRHFSAALLAALASAPALARADGKTELQRQLADIEKASGGRLGVSILDTGSGLRAGHRADERFPTEFVRTSPWCLARALGLS